MDQFYLDLGISVVITLLRSIKDEARKNKFRGAFLKVNKLIAGAYGDDPAFAEAWASEE